MKCNKGCIDMLNIADYVCPECGAKGEVQIRLSGVRNKLECKRCHRYIAWVKHEDVIAYKGIGVECRGSESIMRCTSCGSNKQVVQKRSGRYALVCKVCGKFMKWVGVKDYSKYGINANEDSGNRSVTTSGNICLSCGAHKPVVQKRSGRYALVCKTCGKFMKWIGVKDYSKYGINVPAARGNRSASVPSNTCPWCGGKNLQRRMRGEGLCGLYCTDCGKWVRWLKKSEWGGVQGTTMGDENKWTAIACSMCGCKAFVVRQDSNGVANEYCKSCGAWHRKVSV